MEYEITIKKVFRFVNTKNGVEQITFALAKKDYTNINVPGNWIYLKDTPEELSQLVPGIIIRGTLNNSTLTIMHGAGYAPPPVVQTQTNTPPPVVQTQNNAPPPPYNQAPPVEIVPPAGYSEEYQMIQKIRDELEELRLMLIGRE